MTADPFRDLVNRYARAVDRGQYDDLCALFIEGGRIHGPGFDFTAPEGFTDLFAGLEQNFKVTQHRFFNQMIEVDGDSAKGETYAQAAHIVESADGHWECHDWAIRYQDQFVRHNDVWKFKSRELVVDWIQTTPAKPLG